LLSNLSEFIAIDYVVKDSIPKGSDVIIFNAKGEHTTKFGRTGNYEGSATWYHDIAIDDDGANYTVDIIAKKIERFKRKKSITVYNKS
jgi:hypothetical protein